MKKIINKIVSSSLNLFGMAVGAASLFAVNMSVGTMSLFNSYEPQMPVALIAKDNEEST